MELAATRYSIFVATEKKYAKKVLFRAPLLLDSLLYIVEGGCMMSIGKKNRIEFMNKGIAFMNTHPTRTI